jgi:VWFA-related protein
MKKFISWAPLFLIISFFFGTSFVFSRDEFQQELSHVVNVINIAVPVRVFKGGRFIDTLSLDDFEVYEDGRPQKIEAVYLIRDMSILKEEGRKKFAPDVKNRHFVLLFEMDDYLREMDAVLDYFFTDVLTPGDSVIMITPRSSYRLKEAALARTPREKIAERFKAQLKIDLQQKGIELRGLTMELRTLAADASSMPAEMRISMSRNVKTLLMHIREMKRVDESRLINFADALKKMEGQKDVFLFYQKEDLPVPAIFSYLLEDFDLQRRDYIDQGKIQRLFADASISIHFLFETQTRAKSFDASGSDPSALILVKQGSDDVYSAFRDMAGATGGFMESSANPVLSFQKAVEASENYYILYYKPSEYKPDGRFKKIEVKVKSGSYRITHQAGYTER